MHPTDALLLLSTYTGSGANFTRELVGRTACVRPGQYDGLKYCGDRVQQVATTLDKCGGYAARDGVYKYHVTPICLQQQLRCVWCCVHLESKVFLDVSIPTTEYISMFTFVSGHR